MFSCQVSCNHQNEVDEVTCTICSNTAETCIICSNLVEVCIYACEERKLLLYYVQQNHAGLMQRSKCVISVAAYIERLHNSIILKIESKERSNKEKPKK